MPNDLLRMRPQGLTEQAPMPEPAPLNERDILAQFMMQGQGQPQQQPSSLGAYIANMKAMDPSKPQMRAAPPAPPQMAGMPGLSDLIAMFQGKAQPDPAIDQRLGQQAGGMFLNNQRHAQKLDDFERDRARQSMLLNQLQGVR